MNYDLLIDFSYPFLTAPLERVALTTFRITLNDITNIDKICDEVGQIFKFRFLCKLIGCEAQERAE